MNLFQNVLPNHQSTKANDLAFVPSNRRIAEEPRADAGIPEARRPAFDTTNDPKGVEDASRIDVPLEELRLLASHSHPGGRGSAERTSRLRVGLLIGGLVAVAALLAWQHRGDEVKQMASSSMASLWPGSSMSPARVSTAESESISAARTDASGAGASEQAPTPTTPSDRAAAPAAELQQQMQSIAHDLNVMKQNLEQLTAKQEQLSAKQEQMARDIASLRTVKPDDKMNPASARTRSVDLPPRKKPPGLPPPPGPKPSSVEQVSSGSPQPVVRSPTPPDVVARPPQPQDAVVRPPMPLRQE